MFWLQGKLHLRHVGHVRPTDLQRRQDENNIGSYARYGIGTKLDELARARYARHDDERDDNQQHDENQDEAQAPQRQLDGDHDRLDDDNRLGDFNKPAVAMEAGSSRMTRPRGAFAR